MKVNNVILIEGGIIIALGVIYVIQNNRPVTPVFVGGIGLLLIVSLLEVLGKPWDTIGTALLTLATGTIIVSEGGALLSGLQNALGHTSQTTKVAK